MNYIICALAVYKLLQVIDSLLPREPMPWVKNIAGVILGYAAALIVDLDKWYVSGLVVATIAGSVQLVLRLTTLLGDSIERKTLR